MLAVQPLSPTAQAWFYLVAVVLFLLGALGVVDRLDVDLRVDLTSLGLAVFVAVFAWQAWSLT